ncbi:formylglycine-generating enzyme family protein [Bacteroidota bacterium]
MKYKVFLTIRSIFLMFFMVSGYCYPQNHSPYNMVLIPGGEFNMGKDWESNVNFSPSHKVFVDPFYMDVHEVTNGEYIEFCRATGHRLPEFWNVDLFRSGENYPDYPVVGVNWSDAMEYARWSGKRLPTEAEWEFAARGGLAENEFPNGNTWDHLLKRNEVTGNWINLIEKVMSIEPNGYGLFDTAGNVWEWIQDRYQHDYYGVSTVKNPTGPETGTSKVIRGGSWHSNEMCHKVYFRKGLTANWVDFAVGFRCVKDIR